MLGGGASVRVTGCQLPLPLARVHPAGTPVIGSYAIVTSADAVGAVTVLDTSSPLAAHSDHTSPTSPYVCERDLTAFVTSSSASLGSGGGCAVALALASASTPRPSPTSPTTSTGATDGTEAPPDPTTNPCRFG